MATVALAPSAGRRPSLERIDAAVSQRLGPTRLPGNAQPACFNRQIAMYLARNVGRWSTTAIGHFYNGRDHSTVSYGIQRIEALRETDPEVDGLLTDLKRRILENNSDEEAERPDGSIQLSLPGADLEQLADLIAERVCASLERRLQKLGDSQFRNAS